MTALSRTDYESRRRGLFALVVFLITLAFYIATLPETILPGDSGELITSSQTLSIAHPPGYPLYILTTKVFSSAVPLRSVAYRYNLFSALVASLTAALFYLILTEVGLHTLVSLGLSLAFALHGSFWIQATAAEVYPLNAFFTVLLFYSGLLARRYGEKAFLLMAYVGGLAFSHHLTLVYTFIAAMVFPLIVFKIRPRTGTIALCLLLFILGLTTWLYIPVRARLSPPFTWGNTDTAEGFVSHILAGRYKWRLKTFDLMARMGDSLIFFRSAIVRIGPAMLALAVLGVVTNFRRIGYILAPLLLVVFSAIHYALYNIPDIEGHVLPAMLAVALLAGLGLRELLAWLGDRLRQGPAIVIAGVFGLALVNIINLSPRADESFAHDYGEAVIASATSACGPGALIMTAHASAPVATVSYLTYVEKRDVQLYIHGISNPSIIGSETRVASMSMAMNMATREFGEDRICLMGGAEAQSAGGGYPICGMVSLLDSARYECTSPHDYRMRGVGEEPRDFFSRLLSAEYYLDLARWHIARGEFDEASGYLERAIGFTGDAQTYVQASRSYVSMDRLDEALRLLEEAVEAEPTHFFAHFALANVLQLKGREEDALSEYEKALRGNPYTVPVYINLGNLYWERGENARALEYFRAALETDSASVSARMGAASALEEMGRPDEALQYLNRVISLKPGNEEARHTAVSILMRLDRYDEARIVLDQGLTATPRSGLLLADMGLYHLRTDSPDSAIAYLRSALDVEPDLLTARGNLAVAYEREGLPEEAAAQYRAYIESAPPGPGRQMAERALRRLTE